MLSYRILHFIILTYMKPAQPVRKAARKSAYLPACHFTVLRLNGQLYHIGDVVRVKEWKDEECFGTLLDIYRKKNCKYPLVKIRWFYKPSDIFTIKQPYLSEGELFDSDHVQEIWLDCIYDKVTMLSLEDYRIFDEVDDDTFFTRATYKHITHEIVPPFQEWKRVCTCNSILNPDSLYNVCERCGSLFHQGCVKSGELNHSCPKCK